MVWLWLKYIQPAVLKAQAATNAQIAEAERRRDSVQAALSGLQDDVGRARRDADGIKQRAAAQAEAEHQAALIEARESGDRALRNAQQELGRARAAARDALRAELIDRALAVARREASARVDDRFNATLVNSFVGGLHRDGSESAS